jgi:hypothetical protein
MATRHQLRAAFSLPVNGHGGDSGADHYVGIGGYSTIQAAVNAAQEGDTIFIQPGTYDENVVVTTNYVTLVGAQVGRYGWPDLVATTGVALTVDAQGFVCKNVRISSGDTDCVVQEGNGFKYEECVFDGDGQAATEALVRLKGNATDDSKTASEGLFLNCLFRGNAAGVGLVFDTGDAPGNGVGSTDVQVVGCHFVANAQDMTTQDTGGGVYSVQHLLVKDCTFEDKNKTNYIDFTTSSGGAASDQNGTIMGCYFATDSITTTNIAIVGTGFTVVGCYDTVGVQDGSGLD